MADIGVGITIVFGTTGFTAELIDIDSPEASREAVETTHQGTTTARTFMPQDLVDWGGLDISFAFDPGTDPPIDELAEAITITWPDSETWAFSGFMTNYRGTAPLNDKMTGTATVKVTGDVTVTP